MQLGEQLCEPNIIFIMYCIQPKRIYSTSDYFVPDRCKLTRNKNARHIFPRHFLTVAMIGIICLYMHFVLFIFHTRSLFFKYLHYFRHMTINAQNARKHRALQLRGFSMKNLFLRLLCSLTEQKSCVKKN